MQINFNVLNVQSVFPMKNNSCDEEKIYQEHDVSFLNLRDNGGLMWPKLNAVALFGLVFTSLYNMLNDE